MAVWATVVRIEVAPLALPCAASKFVPVSSLGASASMHLSHATTCCCLSVMHREVSVAVVTVGGLDQEVEASVILTRLSRIAAEAIGTNSSHSKECENRHTDGEKSEEWCGGMICR